MSRPIFICIPAYKEKGICKTLTSLAQCKLPIAEVMVLVFINGSEADTHEIIEINESSFAQTKQWIADYEGKLSFELLRDLAIPSKLAGVGTARKVLGDKAIELGGGNGILAYLDADCTVADNYLTAIEGFFSSTKCEAACIHYEHEVVNPKTQGAIIDYELHLRYYIAMQDWLKLPFAFHTVGSSMAVRLDAYQKRGGMNRKKAGEDFYFLQKYCKAQTIGKITETTVFPSARTSDRVPFGTGRAMEALENGAKKEWLTYNPESFELLSVLIEDVPSFYQNEITIEPYHLGLQKFLTQIGFIEKVEKLKANAKTSDAFIKNFFQLFDAFQLMKYLHFIRDEYQFQDVKLSVASQWYCENILQKNAFENNWEALQYFRLRDKALV